MPTTYKELKILTKHYELILWAYPVVSNFPAKQRFVLGQQIQNSLLEVLKGILEANSLYDKTPVLKKVSIELDQTKYLFRLAHDLKFLSTRQWLYSAELLSEVGKMLGGWLRASAGVSPSAGTLGTKSVGFAPALNKQEGGGY